MNRLIKSLAVAVICLLTVGGVQGQNKNKIGHINSNELLQLMPERLAAEKKLEEETVMLRQQLDNMGKEYETKITEYQNGLATMNDLIKQAKEKEIQDLEQRIKDFQGSAQEGLGVKEQELLKPIVDKAKKAIEDVAAENGYTYVIDSGLGVLLVFPEGDDIMPLVKTKLGISANAVPAPTGGN